MTLKKLKSFAALVAAPLWVPIRAIQDRGYFLDGATEAIDILYRLLKKNCG